MSHTTSQPMSHILFIENKVYFHYEVIESIIVNYSKIIQANISTISTIYLVCKYNSSFFNYIKNKYPSVIFSRPTTFDYYISVTSYDEHYYFMHKNSLKHYYICHEVTPRLNALSNTYFLTPLGGKWFSANILPFAENKIKIKSDIPIYVVQGKLEECRRNYKLLKLILSQEYDRKFIMKLVGFGEMPQMLEKFSDKIILRNKLNFEDYHKEFLDAYCILPLITISTHPQYYTNKLTSTINYSKGYKLKCLIDKDLQSIYQLDCVEIFDSSDPSNIVEAFKKTLRDFN